MNENFSSRPNYYSWLWLGLFSLIFLLSLHKIINFDIWFHLRTAQYSLNQGALPTTNIFSFPNYGVKWEVPEWFAQVIYYIAYLVGSFPGLVLFKALVVLCIFILLFKRVDKDHRYSMIALAIIWAAFCGSYFRFTVRPHMLFYLHVISMLYLLELYQKGLKIRTLLPLFFVLGVFWGNTHGSAFYVLIFAGAFLFELVVKSLTTHELNWKDSLRDLMILAAVLFLAVCVNPYGLKIYIYPFWHFSAENIYQAQTLAEYRLPGLKDYLGPFGLFIVVLPVVVYSLWQKRQYAYLLLLLFFAYMAVRHIRFVAVFLLAAAPIYVNNLPSWRLKEKKLVSLITFIVVIFLGLFFLRPHLYIKNDLKLGLGVDWPLYPRKAAGFIGENLADRQGGNEYRWGGYLLWVLPEMQNFIDGRSPDSELYQDYADMMYNSHELNRIADKYQLEYMLIPRIDAPAPLKPGWLFARESWGLVYWDSNSYIFVRRNSKNKSLLDKYEYQLFNPLLVRLEDVPIIMADKNNVPKLKKELERAYQADMNNRLATYALGDFYQLTGKWQQSLGLFQRFVQENPQHSGGWYLLGLTYENLNKIPQAKEAYQASLKLQPEYNAAQNRLLGL